jgi:hypothetical protein
MSAACTSINRMKSGAGEGEGVLIDHRTKAAVAFLPDARVRAESEQCVIGPAAVRFNRFLCRRSSPKASNSRRRRRGSSCRSRDRTPDTDRRSRAGMGDPQSDGARAALDSLAGLSTTSDGVPTLICAPFALQFHDRRFRSAPQTAALRRRGLARCLRHGLALGEPGHAFSVDRQLSR